MYSLEGGRLKKEIEDCRNRTYTSFSLEMTIGQLSVRSPPPRGNRRGRGKTGQVVIDGTEDPILSAVEARILNFGGGEDK